MPRILAIANPTSRSGKTSTAYGLASMLADLGQNVLCVDLDAQAALTRLLGVDAETLESSVFDVLMHGRDVVDVMTDCDVGVDLLPAAVELSGVEASLVTRAGREHLLQTALSSIADEYDWIVIDCPSALGLLTLNALSMAHSLLVPVREASNRSLSQLLDAAHEIKQFVNPALDLTGVLAIGAQDLQIERLPILCAIPQPPLALNAYREFAKRLIA